jgi:hypothetical protein
MGSLRGFGYQYSSVLFVFAAMCLAAVPLLKLARRRTV